MPLLDCIAAWFDALPPVWQALVCLGLFGAIVAILQP